MDARGRADSFRDRGLAKKGERLVFLFGGTRMLGVTNIMKIGTIS
jgi:hypothetical protein